MKLTNIKTKIITAEKTLDEKKDEDTSLIKGKIISITLQNI